MGKYKYSNSEKETLKVLKMQEQQLKHLESVIAVDIENGKKDAEDLADLRKRAEVLLKKRGITPPQKKKNGKPIDTTIRITQDEIPSWDSIAEQAKESVPEDVAFEDLLTKEEFQFCIDEVQRINDEFSRKTGIVNKKDLSFLVIASVLQTARWLIIQEICGDIGQTVDTDTRISSKEGDKLKHSTLSKFQEKVNNHDNKRGKYPSWKEILWGSYPRTDGEKSKKVYCPYDAQDNAPSWFEKGSRGAHRSKTLGHDAIIGWIFGTANIMSFPEKS